MEPANVVLDESVERYPEAVEILLKAWTEDRFTFEGKYYQAHDLQVVPKPIQKPHPPIWQVGTSAKWVERAVRNGWGVALGGPAPNIAFEEAIGKYHEACEALGAGLELRATSRPCYLDEDNDRAIEEGREPLTNFIHFNVSPMDSLDRTPEGKQQLIDAALRVLRRRRLPEHAQPLLRAAARPEIVYAGSPEKVAEQLIDLLGPVPLRRVPADRQLRRQHALAGDEDPGAVHDAGRPAHARGRREDEQEERGRAGLSQSLV